jgi:hypothetical protein
MPGASGAKPEYFDLFHLIDIDRFEQLRLADPSTLRQQLAEVIEEHHIGVEVPTEATIEEWIRWAAPLSGELPRTEGSAAAKAEQQAQDTAGGAAEQAQGAAGQVTDQAGQAAQGVQDAAGQAAQQAQDTAGTGPVFDPDWHEAGGPKKDDW